MRLLTENERSDLQIHPKMQSNNDHREVIAADEVRAGPPSRRYRRKLKIFRKLSPEVLNFAEFVALQKQRQGKQGRLMYRAEVMGFVTYRYQSADSSFP
jgi:hypothetical protein